MAEDVPAFPGAEGFARYTTTGGRGGKVYHVTNLSDKGVGSLRWAVSQDGPKTVVFDVSGYIDLISDLTIPKNTTIAGQTAPGDGITIRYRTVQLKGDNIIVRFLRFRRSQVTDINDGADAAWGRNYKNIILDHCSFSWSIDEVASFYDNRDFTMQWCNVAEGLANPGHSKGEHSYGGIWGGKGASFHHNFIAHVQNRSPRFNGARYLWNGYDTSKYENTVQAEQVDFRNCVMYNWGSGNGCYGGPGGGYINMINNYYKAGPATNSKTRVTQVSYANTSNAGSSTKIYGLASRYYINGNYVTAAANPENYDWDGVSYDVNNLVIDGDRYCQDTAFWYGRDVEHVKIQTNSRTKDSAYCVRLRLDEPIFAGEVTTHSAERAYEKVVAYAGASLVRDAVDARHAEEVRTGTCTYTGLVTNRAGILDKINDPNGTQDEAQASFPDLASETRPEGYDTDGDGMPDAWEDANGLDKNDPDDGQLITLDTEKGWYTNLEVYLNGIVENIIKAQNEDADSAIEEYYPAQTTVGISSISGSQSIVRTEYFDLSGKLLSEPQGICVRRITYANGFVSVDKVMKI